MAPSSTKDAAVYSKLQSADVEKDEDHYDDATVVVCDDDSSSNTFSCLEKPLLGNKAAVGVPRSSRRVRMSGCMTCCVIFLVVLTVLLAITVGFAVYGYMWMANQVERWSVTTPNPDIPVLIVPDSELQVFKDRGNLFFDLINAATSTDDKIDDLVVTARNLNGLAGSSDYFRGGLFATLTPNQIVFDVSLPLEGYLPGGKGRFIVGTETMTWDPATSTIHDRFVPRPTDTLPQPAYWDMKYSLTRKANESGSNTGVLDLQIVDGQFFDYIVTQDVIDQHVNLLETFYQCDCDDDDCKSIRKTFDSMDGILLQQDQVVFQAHAVPPRHSKMIMGSHPQMMGSSSDSSDSSSSDSSDSSDYDESSTGSHTMIESLSSSNKQSLGHNRNHGGRSLRAAAVDADVDDAKVANSSSNWKFKMARRLAGL